MRFSELQKHWRFVFATSSATSDFAKRWFHHQEEGAAGEDCVCQEFDFCPPAYTERCAGQRVRQPVLSRDGSEVALTRSTDFLPGCTCATHANARDWQGNPEGR
jgi:hypothetical protein